MKTYIVREFGISSFVVRFGVKGTMNTGRNSEYYTIEAILHPSFLLLKGELLKGDCIEFEYRDTTCQSRTDVIIRRTFNLEEYDSFTLRLVPDTIDKPEIKFQDDNEVKRDYLEAKTF